MNDSELIERLGRTRPTITPSVTLEQRVAQLARTKSATLARPVSGLPLIHKLGLGLAGAAIALMGGLIAAFGPRLSYANTLSRAAEQLRRVPIVHATTYRVGANGAESLISDAYYGKSQTKLTYQNEVWLWQKENGKDVLYAQLPSKGTWRDRHPAITQTPQERLSIFASLGKAIYFKESFRLFPAGNGEILVEGPDAARRCLVHLEPHDRVTLLETQVWDKGAWHPALRTRLEVGESTPTLFAPPQAAQEYKGENLLWTSYDNQVKALTKQAREAWERQDHPRLLGITDQWLAVAEAQQVRSGYGLRLADAWLYRTAALRSLGQLNEARNALAHAKRNQPTGEEVISIFQEEADLLPRK